MTTIAPAALTPSAIAQSGIAAATLKLNVSASNLANADDESPVGSGGDYQAQGVAQSPAPGGGVSARVVTLSPAQVLAYDPGSPIASGQGLVDTPDIDPITEVTNQLVAGKAFAMSLIALKIADEEQQSLLDITT